MSRRVVIPGGSGYLGRHLARRLLARGDHVSVLTRGASRISSDGTRFVHWDAAQLGDWVGALDGADAVVHLTGERVDRRPTAANVARLIDSRVAPVELVGAALAEVAAPPRVWVQLSTLAIYGDAGDAPLDESVPPPSDGPRQMVEVATRWEEAFHRATREVDRTALLRFGITLGGPDDPTTGVLARLTRLGMGGTIGSGHQVVSWIALEDALRVLERGVDGELTGLTHVCAPEPVDNATMMATFRELLGARVGLPAPAPLVRLGAPLLGTDPALALTGRRGVPARLLAEGFSFAVPRFRDALRGALADLGRI